VEHAATEQSISWEQDGIDTGWFFAKNIGSVRSSTSYRSGGWWFLPKWLPDTDESDIGPFESRLLRWQRRKGWLLCSSQNGRKRRLPLTWSQNSAETPADSRLFMFNPPHVVPKDGSE
jgi:hypothetical protein